MMWTTGLAAALAVTLALLAPAGGRISLSM